VAYTRGNAVGAFAEQDRGMLRVGMLADIVVLNRDLRVIAPDEIRNAQVQATIVGGKVVYQQ
jgi:predicted amidohydrolase YtcJ